MRKAAVIILTGFAVLGIAGCGLLGPSPRKLRDEAYSMSGEAVNAVIEEDADELESLFCKNTADPDQIEDLLSRIDGDFPEYDDVSDANLPVHFIYDSSEYAIYRSEYSNSDHMVRIISCARSIYDKDDEGVQYIAFYEGDSLIASAGRVIERYEVKPIPDEETEVDINQFDSQGAQSDYDLNVLYYLKEEDLPGFVSLFSKGTKNAAEDNFDDIIDFFGSGIESYSIIDTPGGGSEWEYDHWNYMEEQTSIYDIITTDGEMFEISMNTIFVDVDNPSREGITYFEIRKVEPQVNDLLEHDVIECFVIGKEPNT